MTTADGRASLAGVGDDLPAPSATVAVRIRLRDGAPSVGPNAFFFQEGQAAVFEGARWGEFRVAADGTALSEPSTFEVRVSPTAEWIYWVLGALAGVVIVIGVIRTAMRRHPKD